ncbi:MAG: hypothetical protein NVSMB9_35950 [Isosphaeraceae bacterium]
MAEDQVFFSVVVIGHMNPMIHHASWYHHFDLLTEEETKEAVQSPNTYAIPPMSQIQIEALRIVCQQDKWEIQTTVAPNLERIRRIAERVFDHLLPHTPVSRYGFNFNHCRSTNGRDVGGFLASRLTGSSLGLDPANATSGEITLRRSFEDHVVMIVVKPGTGDTVAVANNFEYPLEGLARTDFALFHLADKFQATFGRDRMEAEHQVEAVVKAFNEPIGG